MACLEGFPIKALSLLKEHAIKLGFARLHLNKSKDVLQKDEIIVEMFCHNTQHQA